MANAKTETPKKEEEEEVENEQKRGIISSDLAARRSYRARTTVSLFSPLVLAANNDSVDNISRLINSSFLLLRSSISGSAMLSAAARANEQSAARSEEGANREEKSGRKME